MWYDEIKSGAGWTSLISDYVSCGCGGIRSTFASCPACGSEQYDLSPTSFRDGDGVDYEILPVFPGAEGRPEDYQLLALMEREWRRPAREEAKPSWLTSGMSERATLVILFWTYFESRMNRLVGLGLGRLPGAVQKDLLKRYDSVTSHMQQLYQILFGVKYRDDLIAIGAESIDGHLARVRDARNRFVHGDPSALSDAIVEAVVQHLKVEHDAWIAVFNLRISLMR